MWPDDEPASKVPAFPVSTDQLMSPVSLLTSSGRAPEVALNVCTPPAILPDALKTRVPNPAVPVILQEVEHASFGSTSKSTSKVTGEFFVWLTGLLCLPDSHSGLVNADPVSCQSELLFFMAEAGVTEAWSVLKVIRTTLIVLICRLRTCNSVVVVLPASTVALGLGLVRHGSVWLMV